VYRLRIVGFLFVHLRQQFGDVPVHLPSRVEDVVKKTVGIFVLEMLIDFAIDNVVLVALEELHYLPPQNEDKLQWIIGRLANPTRLVFSIDAARACRYLARGVH
jgi:hypothetical protein